MEVEPPKNVDVKDELSKGLIAAMLNRVKLQALASASPKRKGKRKRDRKHKAKQIVRKRVKEARRRNRR